MSAQAPGVPATAGTPMRKEPTRSCTSTQSSWTQYVRAMCLGGLALALATGCTRGQEPNPAPVRASGPAPTWHGHPLGCRERRRAAARRARGSRGPVRG